MDSVEGSLSFLPNRCVCTAFSCDCPPTLKSSACVQMTLCASPWKRPSTPSKADKHRNERAGDCALHETLKGISRFTDPWGHQDTPHRYATCAKSSAKRKIGTNSGGTSQLVAEASFDDDTASPSFCHLARDDAEAIWTSLRLVIAVSKHDEATFPADCRPTQLISATKLVVNSAQLFLADEGVNASRTNVRWFGRPADRSMGCLTCSP
jgi:hypothetical protein